MSPKQPPSPEEWFHRKATDYVEAQVLYHLGQAGVFGHLREGPQQAHDLAVGLHLVPEVLTILLEYIEGVGELLTRDEMGRFQLTSFGRAVLERFGREGSETTSYNFFNVRVGAYGVIWNGLGGLLSGETAYGRGLTREGDRAADAVYTVGKRLEAGLFKLVDRLQIDTALEVGVTSGLLNSLGATRRHVQLLGLDRSPAALADAEARALAENNPGVTWLEADLFDTSAWVSPTWRQRKGLLFSVHFHEFLAAGTAELQAWIAELSQQLPGWHLLAIEQPRLDSADRDRVSEVEWLYNHSNILIHHLIGNGRILSDSRWRHLFEEAGATVEAVSPMGFLGYQAYVIEL